MAAEEGKVKIPVQTSKEMTLKDLIAMASVEYGKEKKTIHDYFHLQPNEDISLYRGEWEQVKNTLAEVFTEKDYCANKRDATQIFISPAIWEHVQAVWKPTITAAELKRELEAKQTLDARENRQRTVAEAEKLRRYHQIIHSPYAHFQSQTMNLQQLHNWLKEKVNQSFVMYNTNGVSVLRMALPHTVENRAKRDQIISLLKSCGINAAAKRSANHTIVEVKGVNDITRFENSEEKVNKFLLKYHTEKPVISPNL